jgi:hypothetical protein
MAQTLSCVQSLDDIFHQEECWAKCPPVESVTEYVRKIVEAPQRINCQLPIALDRLDVSGAAGRTYVREIFFLHHRAGDEKRMCKTLSVGV